MVNITGRASTNTGRVIFAIFSKSAVKDENNSSNNGSCIFRRVRERSREESSRMHVRQQQQQQGKFPNEMHGMEGKLLLINLEFFGKEKRELFKG
jgi:hypothetical protein